MISINPDLFQSSSLSSILVGKRKSGSAGRRQEVFAFSPELGDEDWRIWELMASCQIGLLNETAEQMLQDLANKTTPACSKSSFTLSLILDLLKAGAEFWVKDSRLFVRWPDWNSPEGRNYASIAMTAAREMRSLSTREVNRIRPLFAPELDGPNLATIFESAKFRLVSSIEKHPTGATYQEAFGAALRHWTMPYRGRTGRMKRFVVTAEHELLGPYPVIAGIIELGDEAPFCQWRDDLLGLSVTSFKSWIQKTDRDVLLQIAERFRDFRSVLRSTTNGFELSSSSASDIVGRTSELELAAHGRSTVSEEERTLLKDRKRLVYALRLAKGEMAINAIYNGEMSPLIMKWLGDGVRGVHDIVLPRVHLEATVCGAVPPFSCGLGGKLVVSFLSHPSIIGATLGSQSELLDWSFDYSELSKKLPSNGMLCITTKGLYANHAAIYTRSEMPGLNSPLRFRHLANTDGATTTLISERTARYAKALVDQLAKNHKIVSTVYGSGGAKRHRFIEAATRGVGLPTRISFAGISRPVYGVKFVKNAEAVCWLNECPDWTVPRFENPDCFCEKASKLWRDRWLVRSKARVMEYALIPSLPSILIQQNNEIKN